MNALNDRWRLGKEKERKRKRINNKKKKLCFISMNHKIAMGGKGARKEGKTLLIMRKTRPHEQDCKEKEKRCS